MNRFNPEITDAGEIPADILAQLEAAPDNASEVLDKKRRIVDAALLRFHGTKSMDGIAKACGVSHSLVQNRASKLKSEGRL